MSPLSEYDTAAWGPSQETLSRKPFSANDHPQSRFNTPATSCVSVLTRSGCPHDDDRRVVCRPAQIDQIEQPPSRLFGGVRRFARQHLFEFLAVDVVR